MSGNKDFNRILTELTAQGWINERTTQGHWKSTPPDKAKPVVHFSTSDDPRAIQNTIRDLRRAGFVWPPPSKKVQAAERRANEPESSKEDDDGWIEAYDRAVETIASLPPNESPEERIERIFGELKEAKVYVSITEDCLNECSKKLTEAQEAFATAQAEHKQAKETMQQKKAEFDRAFASSNAA